MRLKRFWAGILLIYTFYIIYGTLFPFLFPGYTGARALLEFEQWLKVSQSFPVVTAGDVIQNILLFLPFGYFWGRILVRTPIKAKYGIFIVVSTAFMISYSVEFLQLISKTRFTSFYDVMINVMGAGFGFVLSKYIPSLSILVLARRKIRPYFAARWALPTMAAFFLLLLETWQPFNFSLVVELPLKKMSNFWHYQFNWNLEHIIFSLRYGLLVTMVTAFACAWMFESGLNKFYKKVFLATVFLGWTIESLQFFILSRVPSPMEYLIIFLGTVFGLCVFKYIPQKEAKTRIAFWIVVGIIGAVLNTVPLSGSLDSQMVADHLGRAEYEFLSVRFNKGLHFLLTFFFLGFLITYFIYRYSVMKKETLINSAVCAISFFVTVIVMQGAFVLTWKQELPIYLGFCMGIGLFVWLTYSFKSIINKT